MSATANPTLLGSSTAPVSAIAPVDAAGPVGLVAAGDPAEERVDVRARRMSGAGMDGDARGLVDD